MRMGPSLAEAPKSSTVAQAILPQNSEYELGSAYQRANNALSTDAAATAPLAHVRRRIVSARLIMAGYLVLGVFLGLSLLLLLSAWGRDVAARARRANVPGVVHLYPEQIDNACWQGIHARETVARLTVVMFVNVNGWVSHVSSAGASPVMRKCVEAYARRWEFPPQTQMRMLVMPVEVDAQ